MLVCKLSSKASPMVHLPSANPLFPLKKPSVLYTTVNNRIAVPGRSYSGSTGVGNPIVSFDRVPIRAESLIPTVAS